jgi:hypothetical protein
MGLILFAVLLAYIVLRIAFIVRYSKHDRIKGRK